MTLREIAGSDDPGALAKHAALFLEAGGTPSLAEWGALSVEERAAFVAAGRRVAVTQAVRIGNAARSSAGALKVWAEIDGGRSHDETLLAAAVQGVAYRRSQEGSNGVR